jgi:hypothetical protein
MAHPLSREPPGEGGARGAIPNLRSLISSFRFQISTLKIASHQDRPPDVRLIRYTGRPVARALRE